MDVRFYMNLAAKEAVRRTDRRTFRHCAIGRRSDGVLVISPNGSTGTPTKRGHAEFRLSRKLDFGVGIVFVVRVDRFGRWANSKPCFSCQVALRSKGVRKVVFTTGPNTFDSITF